MSEVASEHVCGVDLQKCLRANANRAQTASLLERDSRTICSREKLEEELRDPSFFNHEEFEA